MKALSTLLLLSALLFNLSCKKGISNEIYPDDCPPPFPLVTKITGTRISGDEGSLRTVNLVFTYDTNIRLVNISDGKKKLDVLYESHGPFKLTYSDSTTSIAKRKVVELVEIFIEGIPSKEVESYYENDQLVSKIMTSYANTNGLTTEVLHKLEDNSTVVEKYTYKRQNIDTYDNGSGTIYTYKYSDKRNPFTDRFLKYRMRTIDFFSINAAIEIEENKNGIRKTKKNVYTYNAEGYPLTVKSFDSNGGVTADLKFEYGSFHHGCY